MPLGGLPRALKQRARTATATTLRLARSPRPVASAQRSSNRTRITSSFNESFCARYCVQVEIIVLALIPVMLEFLKHRLGVPLAWVRAWWPLAAVAAVCAVSPPGTWSGLAAGIVLIPALGVTAGGLVRFILATKREIPDGNRSSWLVGQAAISVGLAGLAVLGWFLVAQALGASVVEIPSARVIVGIFAVCLMAGELALASAGGVGRAAAVTALLTVLISLAPGDWWLLAVATTMVLMGLAQRLEVRPALPGAPGLSGWVPVVIGLTTGAIALYHPVSAAILAAVGLGWMAWRWCRIVTRITSKSHDGTCSCCAPHQPSANRDGVEQQS